MKKIIIKLNYLIKMVSNGTSSPIEAAKVIESGKEIFNISNQPFIDGSKYLENGKFDPCILVTPDFKTFIILG